MTFDLGNPSQLVSQHSSRPLNGNLYAKPTRSPNPLSHTFLWTMTGGDCILFNRLPYGELG